MKKLLSHVALAVALCSTTLAQDGKGSYYEAIQQGASGAIQPSQFKKLEEDAWKDFAGADSYYVLTKTFGKTTEKVWAVVYAETYCNLMPDTDRCNELGALMHGWYEKAFAKEGNQMTVTLSENAEVNPSSKQPPFEPNFEISLLLGFVAAKADFNPLSIKALAETRRQQLAIWNQKKLPKTELIRRQEAIAAAGHFEAYNYWLFKSARPEEFKKWQGEHQAQYQQWEEWQTKNRFSIQKPDIQRPYFIKRS
ncbi:MAG: hypothetical protein ACJ754_07955 [Pyrinomonadaceae bacterium]